MAEIPLYVIAALDPLVKYITRLDLNGRPMTAQEIGIARLMFEAIPEGYRGWCANMLRMMFFNPYCEVVRHPGGTPYSVT